MIQPNVITGATNTIGKAFDWKKILFLVIMTIIVTLIMSYVMKQEVVLYDSNGNITSKGEIKPIVKFSLKKSSV